MTTPDLAAARPAFRLVRHVYLAVFAVSVAALVLAFLLRDRPDLVNAVVWIRGGAVAIAAPVLVLVARAAARGSRAAFVRLRWISTAVPIGVVIIVAVPNDGYPLWMKVEQGVVGAIVLVAAVALNRSRVRALFPKRR
ncbi:hypothetical protein Afil01_26500 [Actinorhabdospora filicis]|uniref:Uncharacterized protein n=1 Tax=Actinorhabdospora filicis TaxID=1785913 RepID=A0A9W6W9C1_9ACTN|nr:hypothetical protein [Actinorhabdospora filicis]GLZ77843.1 hypothetical protein Afil01_26500 [Actinorhabdospora filicis]